MGNKVYSIVTNRILDEMEKGVVPWEKPWFGSANGPRSYGTGKPYSILNQMLLRIPGEYITRNKLRQIGGRCKEGAKAQIVVFWRFHVTKERNHNGEEIEKRYPILRYYEVFHTDQCEGLPERVSSFETISEEDIDKDLEDVKNDYLSRENIPVYYNFEEASYVPALDVIRLPHKDQFISLEGYYSTVFHEIVHSTGAQSRLNRFTRTGSNSKIEYSKEELVAELGSSFLLHRFGAKSEKGFRNSSSYIDGWSRVLQKDPKLIISAAAQAERAVNYILDYDKEF